MKKDKRNKLGKKKQPKRSERMFKKHKLREMVVMDNGPSSNTGSGIGCNLLCGYGHRILPGPDQNKKGVGA